jgi:hypothetical protein
MRLEGILNFFTHAWLTLMSYLIIR